jgi:hypothetical protein
MRSSVVAAAAALWLQACGGNYSNADVEFFAALPRRSDVAVDVPASASQPLQSESGLRGMSQGLSQASPTYAEARRTGDGINAMAGYFISMLEEILRHDPTVRRPDVRIWGPWEDPKAPGFQLRVLIRRELVNVGSAQAEEWVDGFTWHIQYKRTLEPQDAWDRPESSIVDGWFGPEALRKGRGMVLFQASHFRASGMADADALRDLGTLAQLGLGYDNRGSPRIVIAGARLDNGSTLGAAYQQHDGGEGELGFELDDTASSNTLGTIVRWRADTAGRADMRVVAGPDLDAQAAECWDAQQQVVYLSAPWKQPPIEGDPGLCAFGPP